MEMETWKHGDIGMEKWRHGRGDMNMETWTWGHGHGDMETSNGKRKWKSRRFSLIRFPFSHRATGNLFFCQTKQTKRTCP